MDIKKILVADELNEADILDLRAANLEVDQMYDICPQRLLTVIHEYDAVLVRSRTKVTRGIIEAGKRLKLIARAGVGVDNVDIEAASERNILVINAPSANSISACELTCAHILGVSRNIFNATKCLKEGIWNRKDFMGHEIAGKTLGIVGLGRIGREVGKRMKAFEMKVIGYDPIVSAEEIAPFGIEFVDLDDIWKRSNYITFHVPLLPATKHLLNRDTLAQCKDKVVIINVARGGIIDEAALLEGLNKHKVQAAALDVFEKEPPMNEELLRHPSFIPTPHLGASTFDAQIRVGKEIVDQIFKLMKGEKISGSVNAKRIDISFLK